MAQNLILNQFSTLQNSSIIASLNANNTLITNAFADCLSISGVLPNQMQANFDMNNFQIINLPAPGTVNSPVRLVDLQNSIIGGFGLGIFGLLNGSNTWTAVNTFTNTAQSTSVSTGAVVINGGLGVAKNLNVGGTFNVGTVIGTGITTITINNLGNVFPATGADGIVLQNTTLATSVNTVQESPDIRFSGQGWNTSSLASHEVDWIMATLPQSGNPVFGKLAFGCQVNNGGYNFIANFYSAPTIQALFLGNNTNNAQVVLAGASSGSGNGALITVQNGATNVFLLGNKSAVFGGSFDGSPIMYTQASSGSNPFQIYYDDVSNVSLSIGTHATNASNTSTGTLIVNGGAGIGGILWATSIQGTPIGGSTASTGVFTSLTTTGLVGLNQAVVAGQVLSVTGTGSTSGTYSLVIKNSVAVNTLLARDDGVVVCNAVTSTTFLFGGGVYSTADPGGFASTNGLSNTSSTTISTGVGSVKMSSTNPATNSVWIKMYAGATSYWVPGWTTNSP